MLPALIALVCAHLIADFLLQQQWLADNKRNPAYLLLHGFIVAGLSAALSGTHDWLTILAILLTLLAADATKVGLLARERWQHGLRPAFLFALDQLFHLLVIALLAIARPELWSAGWLAQLLDAHADTYLRVLTVVAALVAALPAAGIGIKLLLRPLRELLESMKEGLVVTHQGKIIGWTERLVCLELILQGAATGVALVIAAKAILRVGAVNNDSERRQSEYIIIGTMLSLASVLAIGAAASWALARLG